MSMESLPPEMHTAIRSPGAMSSYCLMAVMNGVQSPLWNFFWMLRSIS